MNLLLTILRNKRLASADDNSNCSTDTSDGNNTSDFTTRDNEWTEVSNSKKKKKTPKTTNAEACHRNISNTRAKEPRCSTSNTLHTDANSNPTTRQKPSVIIVGDSMFKNVKKSYYYETFEAYNGNSRKTWKTINEVTRCKSDKAAINKLELNGMRITNLTKIAEGFNKFFAEICPELSRDIEEVGTSFDEYIYHTSNCFSFQCDSIARLVPPK